jgi:molybdate transport system substrate-binding protein
MRRFAWLARYLAACASALAVSAAPAAELTVSAAASLNNSFTDIGQAYERDHPGVKVHLNFGASGALLQQIAKGAPVDVFASADMETMADAKRQQLLAPGGARSFARNALVVVVPGTVGARPTALADLLTPAYRRIAIGQPASVPAGRYARQALERAGQWQAIAGKAVYTQNVRQALDYVARGEADAGFVYATDAILMKDKVAMAFAVPLHVPITYPIAVTRNSAQPREAALFVDYVRSPAGQAILARHGFGKP